MNTGALLDKPEQKQQELQTMPIANITYTQPSTRTRRPLSLPLALFVIGLLLLGTGMFSTALKSHQSATTATNTDSTDNTSSAPLVPTGKGVPNSLNMGMPGAPISVNDLHA